MRPTPTESPRQPLERSSGGELIQLLRPAGGAARPAPSLPARVYTTRARVPVEHRPWRILVLPPTAAARSWSFEVARWQARLALSLVVTAVVLGLGSAAAVVAALRAPAPPATAAEVAVLRQRLLAVQDSLATARSAAVAGGREAGGGAPAGSRRPEAAPRLAPDLGTLPTRARAAVGEGEDAGTIAAGLPVVGAIASGFTRARRNPLLHIVRPHLGVDVAAPPGSVIAAPAAGRVVSARRQFAYGLTLEIDHGGGVVTRYAHLRGLLVREGDSVPAGAPIATVGSSGLATGPHLHYEVLVDGRAVDPLRFHLPGAAAGASALRAR